MESENERRALRILAGNNSTLLEGVEALLQDDFRYRSLERAIFVLNNATQENHLRMVEVGLETTINAVQALHKTKPNYMTKSKVALYLYTLQNLVFNLRTWRFPNQRQNNFQPNILQKYQTLLRRGAELGIEADVVHRECVITEYRDPKNPVLKNFELLDEPRMNAMQFRLKRYKMTLDPANLFDYNKYITEQQKPDNPLETLQDNHLQILDKIIENLKQRLGVEKLNLAYLIRNSSVVDQVIGEVLGTKDKNAICKVSNAVSCRVVFNKDITANQVL